MVLPDSPEMLSQFENILDFDPLIDEVGFIHPTQFVALSEEVGSPAHSSVVPELHPEDGILEPKASNIISSGTVFWCRDHKLGISTEIILPLYKAVKLRFMDALERYKTQNNISTKKDESGGMSMSCCFSSSLDILEGEVMKHSKALLLLSCDFGTAWNARKLVLSNKGQLQKLTDELFLASLVLSYAPKSECAWSHRRWVIKMIAGKCPNLQEIVQKESELVEKLAEKSKMNYRAWNHRCWLVSYTSREQVMHELKKSKDWSGLHIADNSCFHYRTRLMLRILEDISDKQSPTTSCSCSAELCHMWKEELDWNKSLITRYVGREALWLHRRFLSVGWIKHFVIDIRDGFCHSNDRGTMSQEIGNFIDDELLLCRSCSTIEDNDFEDFQAHGIYSATYLLWLIKQIAEFLPIELRSKFVVGELKTFMEEVCPEKIFLLYSFQGTCQSA
ncbi:Protein geranylgeranyltransferase type II [Bertholletia excelsa]